MSKSMAEQVREARINEEYLSRQAESYGTSEYFRGHKESIRQFQKVYGGDLSGLFSENAVPSDKIYVENKIKNATHDIVRLAMEAKGSAVFIKEGESKAADRRARIRSSIAESIWCFSGAKDFERKLFLDLLSGAMAAVSLYKYEGCTYPEAMRLNPMYCYPDIRNGKLVSMFYMETIKERIAARLFPDYGLDDNGDNVDEVTLVQYMDDHECHQAFIKDGDAQITSSWVHDLGRVPVAFVALDSADDRLRGLLDQAAGPLIARNYAVRLVIDYLEDLAHAPFEERGILNANVAPGPDVVYHHDPNEDNTFMRRVAPAQSSGDVWNLVQYLEGQEAIEAVQPPARVGTVRQSIASGSFVESTQGALSSVVRELQDQIAKLRVQANTIGMKIDERWLDFEKPLYRPVGNKTMYTPSEDIKGFYYHEITYGAAAGLDRQAADVRLIQHKGAGFISDDIARQNIDYLASDPNIQDDIDREQLRKIVFQKFAGDPNTPMSALIGVVREMDKGKSLPEALEQVAPELVTPPPPQAAQPEALPGIGGPQPEPAPDAGAEQLALEQGGAPSQQEIDFSEIAIPPITQISVS